jgi:hypothetical protein
MNARLEKLAEQAGFKNVVGVLDGKVELQKFAELLIRECAAEADKQTIYCRGIPWGRWIREHFGVEE